MPKPCQPRDLPLVNLRYGISVLLAMILVSVTLNLVTLPFAQIVNE